MDDDPAQLALHARIIKEAGFRAITARIGRASLSFPDHERPALVLMGYGFSSELTPRQVLQVIRGHFPSIPVLIFSARPELPEEMKGLVDGFIHNDRPDSLIASLVTCMQRAKSVQCDGE